VCQTLSKSDNAFLRVTARNVGSVYFETQCIGQAIIDTYSGALNESAVMNEQASPFKSIIVIRPRRA